MHDLQSAIAEAQLALAKETGERALRERAEALRAVIQRIECTFKATGQRGGGWGKRGSELATVTIYPVVGESGEYQGDSRDTVIYSSAQALIACNALLLLLQMAICPDDC